MTSEDLLEFSNELFSQIVARVDGPRDAGELMVYLHVLVWHNSEKGGTTEDMLAAYKAMFLEALTEAEKLWAGETPTLQ